MNYVRQLNCFYQQLPTAQLSSQAVCLYVVLLHINNQSHWKASFSVANGTLMGLCHLSERALRQARTLLVDGGWITYTAPHSGQRAGRYTVLELQAQANALDKQAANPSGERTEAPTEAPTKAPTEAGANLHAYYKQNKKETSPLTPQGGRRRAGRQKNPALRYTQRSPEELAQYDDILWL